MRLRIVDYVANRGGGVRFVHEVVRALRGADPGGSIELVSHGEALDRYREAVAAISGVACIDRAPLFAELFRRIRTVRGGGRLLRLLGISDFHVLVPPDLLQGADVVWFPWVHRHRFVGALPGNVVGTFHDAIMLVRDDIVPPAVRRDELETTRRWFNSSARMVVTSHATRNAVAELLAVSAPERIALVPVAWDHFLRTRDAADQTAWDWSARPFVLCPANTSPHKNHEVLISGMAQAKTRMSLALTGDGAGLVGGDRATALRRHALQCGFELGTSLHPLGYLSNDAYRSLLVRAWALIMPTLGEGGGSFPVLEAMTEGIPVICSDIPVMREQLQRTGGSVLWFDPYAPASLAARIDELASNYEQFRQRALAQRHTLTSRSWSDVAEDYLALFRGDSKSLS